MRRTLILLAAVLALQAPIVQAQVTPEVRPFAGAYIPTGDQADVLKSSFLVGIQAAVEVNEALHLLGTFGYATPRPDRPAIGNDVHIYQYDVGAELFRIIPFSDDRWSFRPFAGAGLGARTHDFKDRSDTDAQTYFAGYGALGAEIQHRRVALRIEARDYVTRFKGLLGNEAAVARNDVMLGAGVAFHVW